MSVPSDELGNSFHAPSAVAKHKQQPSYFASTHNSIPDRKHHRKHRKADLYQGLSKQRR